MHFGSNTRSVLVAAMSALALAPLACTSHGPGSPADLDPSMMHGSLDASTQAALSVLEHHLHSTRDGAYVDSNVTKSAAASKFHMDAAFSATINGAIFGEPLSTSPSGKSGQDAIFVATDQNHVTALDGATGDPLLGPVASVTRSSSRISRTPGTTRSTASWRRPSSTCRRAPSTWNRFRRATARPRNTTSTPSRSTTARRRRAGPSMSPRT